MIDTATIPGSGPSVRTLVKATRVGASPMTVWSVWTTREGIDAWWGPAASNIELRIGGPFEILFSLEPPEGSRGSEGCRFLAYVPGEMVAFTWNAPPQLPLRAQHTWVVVTFEAAGEGQTSVRLVHTGFLDGEDWDDYRTYFDSAWDHVLGLLVDHWSNGRA